MLGLNLQTLDNLTQKHLPAKRLIDLTDNSEYIFGIYKPNDSIIIFQCSSPAIIFLDLTSLIDIWSAKPISSFLLDKLRLGVLRSVILLGSISQFFFIKKFRQIRNNQLKLNLFTMNYYKYILHIYNWMQT